MESEDVLNRLNKVLDLLTSQSALRIIGDASAEIRELRAENDRLMAMIDTMLVGRKG